MIILSGGTGTPKLINGLRDLVPDEELHIIVNTGEDFCESGVLVTADIDTLLYLFSGDLDTSKWWGVRNETWHTYDNLKRLGYDELLPLSDFDRAVNILRTDLLNSGKTLTEATEIIAGRLGVSADICPMTDGKVDTMITMKDPETGVVSREHYQNFWVGKKGRPDILKVEREGADRADLPEKVRKLLEDPEEKYVIIGPSNPVTSIGPILGVPGMRGLLRSKTVVAVSPIIGNEPVSGPAGKLMKACGMDVSSVAVAEAYRDIIDIFVCDIRDSGMTPDDAEVFEKEGIRIERYDTLMKSGKESAELASFILELFDGC